MILHWILAPLYVITIYHCMQDYMKENAPLFTDEQLTL